MRLPFFRKKRYYCIHCWLGNDKKQFCPHCGTPTYTIDGIMKAAIEQLKEKEDANSNR